MKTFIYSLTAALLGTAALADFARPVLQSSTTKALVDDLATGAKTLRVSAAGTLVWESGAGFTGASYFRTAAGLAIGTNVQGYDADLTTWAGITPSSDVQALVSSANFAAIRTNLNLVVNTTVQGYDADLTTWADITPSANVRTFVSAADFAAMRTALSLGSLAVQSTAAVVNGGTGQTTYANGQILIGNTTGNTLAKATLTAGSGISITNGAGSITIAATGGGLTIGTTTISGASANDLLITDGSVVQKITPGTGVITALGNAVNAASGLLTYGLIGTSGATVPLLNAANTWASSQTFSSVLLANSSASAPQYSCSGSTGNGIRVVGDRVDFWVYNVPVMTIGSSTLNLSSSGLTWGSNAGLYGGSDGTGRLVQRAGTSAQAYSVANTYTSSTNKEEVELGWTSNVAHLWTIKGSGGGSSQPFVLGYDSTEKMRIGANTTDHSQPVKLKNYIVSGLPSASTCGEGSMAWVTDATLNTAYTTVIGGGSNKVLVISDGTNWIIH